MYKEISNKLQHLFPRLNLTQPYEKLYRLYHYQDDVFRLIYFTKKIGGLEKIPKVPISNSYCTVDMADYKYDKPQEKITNKEELERISLSRTKRNIKELCLCNNFKYFVTLTVNSKNADRFSLQECQDKLKRLIKNYSMRFSRRKQKFHYILITEKHKDGAFHFHGLFSDLLDTDLYTNEFGYLSSHFFDEQLGFCSFSEIKDILKCANYITKYITKDCIKNEHNQIYMCSKRFVACGGLRPPRTRLATKLNNQWEFLDLSKWLLFCKRLSL